MLAEFSHEGLAEAHHFVVALALRIEVGTTLAAAHGERGQAVLEDLFEAEELQHGKRHFVTETDTALVRADGGVELHAVATVHLNVTLVIEPRHAESDHAFRFDEAVDHAVGFPGLVLFEDGVQGFEEFADSLVEEGLVRITGDDLVIDFLKVSILDCHFIYLR